MLKDTAGTADPGSVLILTGGSTSLAGHVPEGVQIWVRGDNYGGHTTVTVADGTLNDGRIRMESADQGYTCNLALAGVLINGPTGVIDSQVGTGGDRAVSGTLVNQGILAATNFFITYYGTYEVAGGRALGAANVFNVAVRQTESPAVASTLRLVGSSTRLTDNLPNVELWVKGSNMGGAATLNVAGGLVNRGIIRVESTDQGHVRQIYSEGTLQNASSAQLRFAAGSGGTMAFTGRLLNAGVVTVDAGTSVGLVGPAFENHSSGLVTGQGTYDVNFTLFRNSGVVSPAGGSLFFWGNVETGPLGVIGLDLAGPVPSVDHEQLFVTGILNLSGSLRVMLGPDYHPVAGTEFLLVSATTRSTTLESIEHPGTSTSMSALYDETSVRLRINNGAPIAVGDTIERRYGVGIKVRPSRLLLNDLDPETDPLVVVSVGGQSAGGASVVPEEGWIAYEPRPGAPVLDSFTYTVRDSAGAETVGTVMLVEAGPDGRPGRSIAGVSVSGTEVVEVAGHGIPGRSYLIQATASLSEPDWQDVGTVLTGPDGTWGVTDDGAPSFNSRFYRAFER